MLFQKHMEVKINKDGKVEFYLGDMIDMMTPEAKIEFVESLSCEEVIIKHVMDQVLEGHTENVYCGNSSYGKVLPEYEIEKARARIIKESANELAQEEITRLQKVCSAAKEEEKRMSDWAWEMYHAWGGSIRPELPDRNFI